MEKLSEKGAVISASSAVENQFRRTQSKLSILSGMPDQEVDEILGEVSSKMPSDVYLTAFTMSGGSIKVSARSLSERSIAQFVVNMDSSEKLEGVSLVSVQTEPDSPYIEFAVDARMKGGV